MRISYIAFLAALVFAPISLPSASFAAPLARVAATVNGDMISALDLEKRLAPELAARKLNPKNSAQASEIQHIRSAMLDNMVNEMLIRQEAERLKITVSDDVINQEMESRIQKSGLTRAEFEKKIVSEGASMAALEDNLRFTFLAHQIVMRNILKKIVISDEQIESFYEQNGGVVSGAAVRVALIVYPSQAAADKNGKSLESGRGDFAAVAREISVGPNAADGGDLGAMNMGDFAPAVRQAVENLEAGKVSPVFALGDALAQVKVLEKESVQSGTSSIDGETRKRIEEHLRASQIDSAFQDYLKQLREKALISIR